MEIKNIEKIKLWNEEEFPFTKITLICSNNGTSTLDYLFARLFDYKELFATYTKPKYQINGEDDVKIDKNNIKYWYYPENDKSPNHQWKWVETLIKYDSDKQLIVRTDSDFILNGFLIEIKRGNIKVEDFSIIYFDDEMYVVKASKTGYIPHRPPGFFDTMNKQLRILVGF